MRVVSVVSPILDLVGGAVGDGLCLRLGFRAIVTQSGIGLRAMAPRHLLRIY